MAFEDDFPFPKVGYVSSMEGSVSYKVNFKVSWQTFWHPSVPWLFSNDERHECLNGQFSWWWAAYPPKTWFCWSTPWKINMEPENHLFEKENHLNQTSIFGFHVNFQGCICFFVGYGLYRGKSPLFATIWENIFGSLFPSINESHIQEDQLINQYFHQTGCF